MGLAAINTGNNLLYLLLGAMLGAMAVSGWLSEQTLRSLRISRRLPTGVPVDREFRIRYEVTNRKRWLASFAVELSEGGLPGLALVPRVGPGETKPAHATNAFVQRGVYPLEALTLSTDFPFGLFRKQRDVSLPGEIIVWPRTDRVVSEQLLGPGHDPSITTPSPHAAAGPRGEFRSLREYRSGDDARDIHWRTSARLRRPVVREYERDAGDATWILLDASADPGPQAEIAVEIAASLCARAAHRRRPFALSAGPYLIEPGTGEAHLERALSALARVDFEKSSTDVEPPAPRERTILVTAGVPRAGYAQVIQAA